MDNTNPNDPNQGGTPVTDPGQGAPAGDTYTPPAAPATDPTQAPAPLGDQPTSEPTAETPVVDPSQQGDIGGGDTSGEQNPGGAPVV